MPALGKLDVCVLNSTAIVDRSKDSFQSMRRYTPFSTTTPQGAGHWERYGVSFLKT